MRAVVLVGGEGTRLRPLTWRTPKALVPILGRPLLEHLLIHLREHGIDHVTLAMTQRNAAIHEAFADGQRLRLAIDYAYEDTPLGSGGAIGAVARAWRADGWRDETFAVVNGDVVTDLDVSSMIAAHRAHNAVLSLALHEVEDPSPFGVVEIDEHDRIHRFVEKPPAHLAPSRLINAGTWIFEPELIDRLDPSTFNRVEDGLFPSLCEAGATVVGFRTPGYWADVGNPSALLRVNLDMAAGLVGSHVSSADGEAVYIEPTSTTAADAQIVRSVIGAGSHLAEGVTVTDSLLWDDVELSAGAHIERSILASGVRIGAGSRVIDSVLGHDVVIDAGVTIAREHLAPPEATPAANARPA
ncbi:MAG: NDP-sugar synthase [Chloroflexi bacterium]|nr:NDP-sugar synthase [Chloroflexota bacterium]